MKIPKRYATILETVIAIISFVIFLSAFIVLTMAFGLINWLDFF